MTPLHVTQVSAILPRKISISYIKCKNNVKNSISSLVSEKVIQGQGHDGSKVEVTKSIKMKQRESENKLSKVNVMRVNVMRDKVKTWISSPID